MWVKLTRLHIDTGESFFLPYQWQRWFKSLFTFIFHKGRKALNERHGICDISEWIIMEIFFPFSLLSSKRQWHMSPRQTSQRQQFRVGKHSTHPTVPEPQSSLCGEFVPDTVSEICAARRALLSSGLLGAPPPSRPADHIPLASGSAVWPSGYRHESRTCDTRMSCSGQSSGNRPRGSPGGPLCPSDFHQLGNRWSCHLLLRQNSVSGRPDKSTVLSSLSCQELPTHKDILLGGVPRNRAAGGKSRCSY